MDKKTRVGILFGGRSAEHEVSIRSAHSVVEALNKEKYEPVLIGISKEGRWHLLPSRTEFEKTVARGHYLPETGHPEVAISPGSGGTLVPLGAAETLSAERVDVVFPVLHGPFGEDGTVQGLLKLANVPYVGAGVLGSAVGMDKDVMKRLLRDAGIPIGKFITMTAENRLSFEDAQRGLGVPMFVKPANLGSSVGVHKVENEEKFEAALADAFSYDRKVIVEEFIKGREVECSVLGNENPIASVPGEIVPHHEFYSYEAKYLDENGAGLEIPAKLDEETIAKIQDLSVRAYTALCCEGLGRVDSFLTEDGRVLVNEINTIPGFTSISMYPKLWEASGLPYAELIDRLIELAISRFSREQELKTSR